MFRVGGDFKKVDNWAKAMGAAPDTLQTMSRNMAEEALELVAQGFEHQKDPYGRPWKDKQTPDGRLILGGKTGRLRRGWHLTRAGKEGFSIGPSVDYAAHHQFGAPRAGIPMRMMVPSKRLGLPPKWREAFAAVVEEQLAAHFNQGGRRSRARNGGVGFVKAKLAGVKRRLNVAALLRKLLRNVSGE
jgi:phage gpG-like protein